MDEPPVAGIAQLQRPTGMAMTPASKHTPKSLDQPFMPLPSERLGAVMPHRLCRFPEVLNSLDAGGRAILHRATIFRRLGWFFPSVPLAVKMLFFRQDTRRENLLT
jgi:hypothetical protein